MKIPHCLLTLTTWECWSIQLCSCLSFPVWEKGGRCFSWGWRVREPRCLCWPQLLAGGSVWLLGHPVINASNGIGRINSSTWLNRENMQSCGWLSINHRCSLLQPSQDLKFRSGERDSGKPAREGNLFCLYRFTARQGAGGGGWWGSVKNSAMILHFKY